MAAHFVDIAFHHIHAHSATGHVRHGLCGGKTGRENQLPDFVIGNGLADRHALLDRLGQNPLPDQPSAVVLDLDHDAATLVLRRHGQAPDRVLACENTLLGTFDAMVQAVADQVGDRVDDALDQALVQLCFLADRDQLDLLAELGRQVADQARKTTEDIVHGHHPDRHHRFLQIPGIALQMTHAAEQAFVQHRVQRRSGLRQHRLGDDEFTDQVDDLVDFFDIHPDGT